MMEYILLAIVIAACAVITRLLWVQHQDRKTIQEFEAALLQVRNEYQEYRTNNPPTPQTVSYPISVSGYLNYPLTLPDVQFSGVSVPMNFEVDPTQPGFLPPAPKVKVESPKQVDLEDRWKSVAKEDE